MSKPQPHSQRNSYETIKPGLNIKQSNIKKSILFDLRPALGGYFGIPQVTRLLYLALTKHSGFDISGLIQGSTSDIGPGLPVSTAQNLTQDKKLHLLSSTAISITEDKNKWRRKSVLSLTKYLFAQLLARVYGWTKIHSVQLKRFETEYFSDFIWNALFSKTLNPSDKLKALKPECFILPLSRSTMHSIGLDSLILFKTPRYPLINTSDFDVLIAQMPFPGKVAKNTKLVIHYHDSIPMTMPHTISDKRRHESTHYNALAENIKSGAYFVCGSETVRQELIQFFPEVEKNATTIYSFTSSEFHPDITNTLDLKSILNRYCYNYPDLFETVKRNKAIDNSYKLSINPTYQALDEVFSTNKQHKFILMVATLEPRKNHELLISAWEKARSTCDRDLLLVLVGSIGWDYDNILRSAAPGINDGRLFVLHDVPIDVLRQLYSNAAATVCPSRGEGFDLTGLEAMCCSGAVIASDIPVHKEIYGDGALYFDPYDHNSLYNQIKYIIYNSDFETIQSTLRTKGLNQSKKYNIDSIASQWNSFITTICST
ncbi:glycosyltransferase family 4 protein [Halothiobacillus diazotrophicus]|uniref:glycosyltransferase family 4 protein n=1 Tax=Halothiobacillus diazotrophicus TaxID=1860122 RepID=UPI0009EEC23E|nr:glycosyltransferase family 1 protein [Halothiobacillus diazotrophicus]